MVNNAVVWLCIHLWLSFDRLYSSILRFDEYSSKIDSFCRKYHRPYTKYIWTKTLHRMNFQRNKRWATNWHICIDHQLAKLCDANVRHVFATLHLIGVTFSITFPKLSLHTFSFWDKFLLRTSLTQPDAASEYLRSFWIFSFSKMVLPKK